MLFRDQKYVMHVWEKIVYNIINIYAITRYPMILFLENATLDLFYHKPNTSEIDPSIQAETKFVMLLIQHNTFFNLSDHLSQLNRSEFKGSNAADNFTCGRTKTAAIVNCLGNHFFEHLKSDMQELPYSLMLDGSNDNGISFPS